MQLTHPKTECLFQTLRRTDTRIYPSIKETLEKMVASFELCNEFRSPPFHFRDSIPTDEILFNMELKVYLMWLNVKVVLHVVDSHTGYAN